MKKLVSLLKATMHGDMNIFKVKIKSNKTRNSQFTMIAILTIMLASVSFSYAVQFGEILVPTNKTYVMLGLFTILVSIIILVEAIYKSQGILFDSKDNDLLLSMPITKKTIVFARLLKLLAFQYIFDFIFMIPAVIEYAILEKTTPQYWVVSAIVILLLPLIPTILGSIIGYIIKAISSIFKKKKKIIQTISTLISLMATLYIVFEFQEILQNLSTNVTKVIEVINKLYYPAKIYMSLIQNFNINELSILVISNIIISVIFVKLASIYYFKIISKSSEITKNGNYIFNKDKTKTNSQFKALLIKEFKRYFSSSIYIINTLFGMIILFIVTICISIDFESVMGFIIKNITQSGEIPEYIGNMKNFIPQIFLFLVVSILPLSVITSSAVSIEGKTINITKSLPVDTKKIIASKIMMSNIIIITPLIILIGIISIRFNISLINIIELILACLILPNFFAIFGLLINFKFPMMNAENDTVIVKQSMSTAVTMFAGMFISAIPLTIVFVLNKYINLNVIILGILSIFIILNLILWKILKNYAQKRLMEI